MKKATEVMPGNGAKDGIESEIPYIARMKLRGVADLVFHRWDCDEVARKSKVVKGGKGKKEDNLETYVYRNDDGDVCIPGEYLRMTVVNAAKYRQDPRSPRKSAMDLFKAGVLSLTPLAPLGKTWDYEHRCRARVQSQGITRTRPAFKAGWVAEFEMMVNLPQYIPRELLYEVVADGGKFVGLADFRPTFGRYQVESFEVVER